jgi:hypothetical protein
MTMEEKIIALLSKVSAKGIPAVVCVDDAAFLRYAHADYEARIHADHAALEKAFVVVSSSVAEDFGGGVGVSYPSVSVKPVAQVVSLRLRALASK